MKKQAEEATKYKEILKEIKIAEAGLYYLRLKDIEKNKKEIVEKVSEQDDEISAVKIDLSHNNALLKKKIKNYHLFATEKWKVKQLYKSLILIWQILRKKKNE